MQDKTYRVVFNSTPSKIIAESTGVFELALLAFVKAAEGEHASWHIESKDLAVLILQDGHHERWNVMLDLLSYTFGFTDMNGAIDSFSIIAIPVDDKGCRDGDALQYSCMLYQTAFVPHQGKPALMVSFKPTLKAPPQEISNLFADRLLKGINKN